MAFGLSSKPPKIATAGMKRPALNMPGLKRGSLPGMQRTATMPKLSGGQPQQGGDYGSLVRLNVLKGLMGPR